MKMEFLELSTVCSLLVLLGVKAEVLDHQVWGRFSGATSAAIVSLPAALTEVRGP